MTRLRTLAEPADPGRDRLTRALAASQARLAEQYGLIDFYSQQYERLYDGALGWMGGGYGGWPADRKQDRTHSPLPYLTEPDWFTHLALTRDLLTRNYPAIGFRERIVRFIGPVGVQFVLTGQAPGAAAAGPVDADGDGEPDVDPVVKDATDAWEEWCERADWGQGETDRETECLSRLIGEGEATLEFFLGKRGEVPEVRHVEPELVRKPQVAPEGFGWATEDDWRWGLLTRPNDAEKVLAMWVADPEGAGGRVVPAGRFVRTKANVDRCVKRGMSDFFPVAQLLRKIEELEETRVHVARIQAAIPWWEHYSTATQAQLVAMAEDMRNPIPAGVPVGLGGGQPPAALFPPAQQEYYPAGSIPRVTAGRQVLPGPVTQSGPLIDVTRAGMRAVAFRFGLPANFTGEGTDSFAGALVAGSDFARIIEGRQAKIRGFTHGVVMMVMALCEESGRLRAGTVEKVKPVLTSPPVVIADDEKQTRTFLALLKAGCADPLKWMREHGDDPKILYANLAAHEEKMRALRPAPAAPGDDGKGQRDPNSTPPGSAGGDGSSPNDNPMND